MNGKIPTLFLKIGGSQKSGDKQKATCFDG